MYCTLCRALPLFWNEIKPTSFFWFVTMFMSGRPLFCGESEVDQLGKIFKWVSAGFHILFSVGTVERWTSKECFFFKPTHPWFQGDRIAFRGGVADRRHAVEEKLPLCLASPNHWFCSRDQWVGSSAVVGEHLQRWSITPADSCRKACGTLNTCLLSSAENADLWPGQAHLCPERSRTPVLSELGSTDWNDAVKCVERF